MSGLFGHQKKGPINSPQPSISTLRIQTSVQGKPIPIVYGSNRIAGNIIWYGDFTPIPIVTFTAAPSGGGGGKGGGGSGGGGGTTDITYQYTVSIALGLCEGNIASVGACWVNKGFNTAAGFGFETFVGDYSQSAWGYLTTLHPTEALTYRGLAYIAAGPFDLGSDSNLPNISVEVEGVGTGAAIAGVPDANPQGVIVDFLTNAHYGVGFPSARLDTALTQLSNYVLASGLVISPIVVEQNEASRYLSDWLRGINCSARWSNGILTFIPWGEQAITGNGVTYTPSITPLYDITEDDLLPNKAGSGSGAGTGSSPIVVLRKPRAQIVNDVQVEYLNRAASYDPVAVDAKDQASIDTYGLRSSDLRTMHFFCSGTAALLSATLQLNREQIANQYSFTLGPKFILPDVEDILTLTRSAMGLNRQAVRIIDIQENDDGSLSFLAEELLATVGAPLYGVQANSGSKPNYNIDPGGIVIPLIFEPTAELIGAPELQVWGAIAGADMTIWGGCNVYVSYDDATYALVLPQIRGQSRVGVLTQSLASVQPNPIGQTIDETNTLQVNLAQSVSTLQSGSTLDATSLNTACYVGGEIVAYRDAALVSGYKYNLTYLVRGAFGTEDQIVTHAIGTTFARLDQGIFRAPFAESNIGATIYLKFQSFNIYGGGLQALSDVPAYPYTIQGTALKSPLPNVENVRTQYTDGFMYIYWDDVTDFRTGIRYKIFKGGTYSGAQQVGDNAHAPFIAFGNDTYWIVAYAQPIPNLYVYSETPTSITITGNMLVKNLVLSSDQQAEGWPGTMSNGVGTDGVGNIRLGGGGDILSEADFLNIPDVLNYGGTVASGTYEIPASDIVNVGYVADCYVNASWVATGVPNEQDVLTMDDFLNQPDILGSASTPFINVKVQIAIADSTMVYGDWTDYVPGVYRAQYIKFRLLLTSTDPNSYAVVEAFSYDVSVKPRIDHYPGNTVLTTGLTINFEPDDASAPSPFNGGPAVGGTMNQPFPFISFSWTGNAGLTPVVTTLNLSQLVFHFEDGSATHVQVNDCNVTAEGY